MKETVLKKRKVLIAMCLAVATVIPAFASDAELVESACRHAKSNFQPGTSFLGCNAYHYRGARSVWPYGNSPHLKLVWIQFAGSDAQGTFEGVAACLVDLSEDEPQVRQCDQKM